MRRLRVIRGGSYRNDSWFLRLAYRNGGVPVNRRSGSGFRVVIGRRKP